MDNFLLMDILEGHDNAGNDKFLNNRDFTGLIFSEEFLIADVIA